MPGISGRFDWTATPTSTIGDGLDRLKENLRKAFQEVGLIFKSRLKSAAQSGAVWTDRTGHARGGLSASYATTATSLTLTLFHTMSYGLWLEVRKSFAGKYAIIMKTIRAIAPQVFQTLGRLIFGG